MTAAHAVQVRDLLVIAGIVVVLLVSALLADVAIERIPKGWTRALVLLCTVSCWAACAVALIVVFSGTA